MKLDPTNATVVTEVPPAQRGVGAERPGLDSGIIQQLQELPAGGYLKFSFDSRKDAEKARQYAKRFPEHIGGAYVRMEGVGAVALYIEPAVVEAEILDEDFETWPTAGW